MNMYAPTPACYGGIWAVSYHLPFTYEKKLSPGCMDESIPTISVVLLIFEVLLQDTNTKSAVRINRVVFINTCFVLVNDWAGNGSRYIEAKTSCSHTWVAEVNWFSLDFHLKYRLVEVSNRMNRLALPPGMYSFAFFA